MLFKKEKPNRVVYLSAFWKAIKPIDRAHILLVAEGAKPMTYVWFTNIQQVREYISQQLHIFVTEARGPEIYMRSDNGLQLPMRSYTVCATEKYLKFLQELWKDSTQSRYDDYLGKMLGYPSCCRKEFIWPTVKRRFNHFILRFFPNPYRFDVEIVELLINGGSIPPEFLFLATTQTPCSIHCFKSRKMLVIWKGVLERYDDEAATALKKLNQRRLAKLVALAQKLMDKGITGEQFKKGYISRN